MNTCTEERCIDQGGGNWRRWAGEAFNVNSPVKQNYISACSSLYNQGSKLYKTDLWSWRCFPCKVCCFSHINILFAPNEGRACNFCYNPAPTQSSFSFVLIFIRFLSWGSVAGAWVWKGAGVKDQAQSDGWFKPGGFCWTSDFFQLWSQFSFLCVLAQLVSVPPHHSRGWKLEFPVNICISQLEEQGMSSRTGGSIF